MKKDCPICQDPVVDCNYHEYKRPKGTCKTFTEECYNHPECMKTLEEPKEWEKEFDQKFPKWLEPKPGAGKGLGALAGTGMYMQYDADRKKRDEEVAQIKEFIRDLLK